MDQHRQKTISGFKWSAIGQVGTEASKFLIGILLARLLGPDAFGLIGMVLVFTGLANIVLEFGFAEALIQRTEVNEDDWSTVFWVNLSVGLFLCVVIGASAPIISSFYEEPELLSITLALSGIFILQSLAVIQRTQFTKNLEFKKLARVDIAGFAGSGILALASALAGFGVWSLVIQHLSRSLIMTSMLWIQSKWRPSFVFDSTSLKSYLTFSIYMFLNRVLGNISMNIDSLVIGKVLGKQTLGFYNRAFFFMLFPVNSFTNVITKVLFPSMSSIQDERERVGEIFKKIIGLISYCIYPIMIGLFVLAEPFVLFLFGEEWSVMIPYLKVFAIIGMAATLSRLTNTAVVAMGDKKLLMKMTLLEKPIVIVASVVGIYWGIWGLLIGKMLISVLIIYYKVKWAAQSLHASPVELVKPTLIPLAFSVIMGALVSVIIWLLPSTLMQSPLIPLLIGVPTGALIYLALSAIVKPEPMVQLVRLAESGGVKVPSVLKSTPNS